PLQALAHLERLANQDDLAEDQGVQDGEALVPEAYPMPLDQLLVQAEQREQKPEINGDDRLFLEFAERSFPQIRFFPPAVSATFSMVPPPCGSPEVRAGPEASALISSLLQSRKNDCRPFKRRVVHSDTPPMDATIGHFQFDG